MHRRTFLIAAGLAATASALPALGAEKKQRARAIIIANSYRNAGEGLFLANTRSDGLLIEERLRALQFAGVDRIEDAGEAELKVRLESFRSSLGTRDLAFVYIAGHGVQIDDENYLLLGDGKTFLSITSIIDSVRQATSFMILMLDACRNRPFEELPQGMRIARAIGKVSGRGQDKLDLKVATLAAPAPVKGVKAFQIRGTGVKVVFATDPQNVAYDAADDSQRNSPFALAIAKRLVERKSLDDVVALATGDVVKATAGDQSPWSQGSIGEPIFLAGPPENKNPARPPFQVPG